MRTLCIEERFSVPWELSLPSPWDELLESYLDVIDTLPEKMTQLEAAIEERAGSRLETQLLMTIPGVSYYSALLIYAELGEVDRFDGHKEVVSYMGLNPNPRVRRLADRGWHLETWIRTGSVDPNSKYVHSGVHL
jgi:transposase